MLIVYKPSKDAPYKVFESGNMNADQIRHAVGYVNWYGSGKKTPEEAIAEAEKDGFQYAESACRDNRLMYF